MENYDVAVIGAGSGMHVASSAAAEGLSVALVDPGPIGGTCLNTGCIPSKVLIYPADVIRSLQDAAFVGVEASLEKVDFPQIMKRMRFIVERGRSNIERALELEENLTWHKGKAEFIGDHILKIGDITLTAPKIAIATGSRTLVPPIKGLVEAGYLDNASLLELEEPPESLIIIGAGYIGSEYGHFFSAIGTDVTILGRSQNVLDREEPEICAIIKKALSKNMNLLTGYEVLEVKAGGGKKVVSARKVKDGKIHEFEAEEVLLATGRTPNSDFLKPEKTGVETDPHGWIKVNGWLETTSPGIWAFGDVIGKCMFRHTANYEATVVVHNMFGDEKQEADYHAVPHAVFTYPPVAGVGMKEAEAISSGRKILVGKASYIQTAKGYSMAEENGFVKVILEEETGRILGCSVVGSEAPELVQQVVYLMNSDYQDLMPVIRSQIIHPTISEVMIHAFNSLERPEILRRGGVEGEGNGESDGKIEGNGKS